MRLKDLNIGDTGIVQQIDKPQNVYDAPANLFVAKFLGTPPINVFRGKIAGEKLYIGEDQVLEAPGLKDQEVYAAVRPEGFVLKADGALRCGLNGVEVMGRDVSVLASHPALEGEQIRAIIPSARRMDDEAETVRFSLDPEKTLLFDAENQTRVEARLQ